MGGQVDIRKTAQIFENMKLDVLNKSPQIVRQSTDQGVGARAMDRLSTQFKNLGIRDFNNNANGTSPAKYSPQIT